MVTFVNYTNTSNITSLPGAFDYASTAIQTTYAPAMDLFGPIVLGLFFLGFYAVGAKYTQERALIYSTFMTMIVAFLLSAAHMLDPMWVLLTVIALMGAVLFGGRLA